MAKKIYKISKFKCHPVTSLTTRKLGSDFDWLIVDLNMKNEESLQRVSRFFI